MSLRIVIIGGVAGGMSAATRARRMNEQASITVLDKCGYISFANCGLPYYLAGRIKSKDKLLLTTPQAVAKRYNIDARVHHEVMRIDRAGKVVQAKDAAGQLIELPYDKLIIATGAEAIVPPIAHVHAPNVFLLRSMEDTFALEQWLTNHKPAQGPGPLRATIIGAGFIGLEMTEALRDRSLTVTLVEKAAHPLPMLDPEMAPEIVKELAAHEARLIAGTGLKALHAANDASPVQSVELEDGTRIETDLVLLSIGVRPNIALAQAAGLKIGASGAIAVDEYQRTSDPDIYAVGDASEVRHGVTDQLTRIPLAGPANRQGRLAGEHAATGSSAPAAKVFGTAIVQVFGLSAGITGLSEAAARKAGLDADSAYVLPNHHAGYYPGAQQMRLKLVYEKSTGRVLGAQAVGREGIDKRLDVIAATLHFRGTVEDLGELDLAYAPQFGAAKDPVHYAAFAAENQRRQITAAISPFSLNGQFRLDVRTPQEFAAGALRGAVNIPVDELRQRIGELDPQRSTAICCQVGLRGYIAQRILQQHGFADVKNLKGGYLMAKDLPK